MPTMFIVCCVLVHCRVGSLEKTSLSGNELTVVHCRVGSLEIGNEDSSLKRGVHFSK